MNTWIQNRRWGGFVVLGLLVLAAGKLGAAEGDVGKESDIFAASRRLGRGVNLGNYLEAPRGQDWGMKVQDDDFPRIKAAGFQSIRLPVKWPSYADRKPPYTIEPEFLQRVDRLIDLAEKAQLNVVLNIHHYDELDRDPQAEVERFAALWRQIASHYARRNSFLYFELNNEPHDKLDDKQWNTVLVQGLRAVRESNPTRPVIIGPAFWNGIWALPKLTLPDDPNLIVTVHCYSPFEFTHQGASWAPENVRKLHDLAWQGNEKELAALRKELDQAAHWAKTQRRPIFLGEFGAYEKAPLESRARWTAAMAREAEARGFSWAYWEYAAGFGLFDRRANAWRQPLIDALMAPR